MPVLFMDTVLELSSVGSPSAEEYQGNGTGSEREGEGQQTESRGAKRREKNRNAAMKSRKKQTERADGLHKELQSLEQSNTALQKEISSLKKELAMYQMTLKQHEPYCHLSSSTTPSPSSSTSLAVPSPTKSSSPRVPPQASYTSLATAASATSAAVSSAQLFSSPASSSSSSPVTVPYTASFLTQSAPQSLFNRQLPISTGSTTVKTVSTDLVSKPAPPAVPGNVYDTSFTDVPFSFLTTTTLSYSHSEAGETSTEAPGYPQLHPCKFTGNPRNSSPPSTISQPALQDFPIKSLPGNLESSRTPFFPQRTSYSQQAAANSESLLTLPFTLSTSSSSDGSLDHAPPSVPPQWDLGKDLSLSELLENNEWILNENNDHQL
ncbi:uncharacterized protein batf2 [Pholidichthys leucotaenia]